MKKIYLSKTDRKILGVCGGISEMTGIDSTLIRLTLVFLCLVTAILPLFVTYIIAGIITPDKPQKS
ncbi:MAG: PspC domain-containing protein [Planctomycetes bacterium RBG_13_44_8b]|nr:MAG: PspC domain-containing protein [Planctomycetes bacterium RBG_13_44_8b]